MSIYLPGGDYELPSENSFVNIAHFGAESVRSALALTFCGCGMVGGGNLTFNIIEWLKAKDLRLTTCCPQER